MGESKKSAFTRDTLIKDDNQSFYLENLELQRRDLQQRREEERNKNIRFIAGTIATVVVASFHIWLLAELRVSIQAKDSRPITIIMQPSEKASDIETETELK